MPDALPPTAPAALRLRIRPPWSFVEPLRRFVEAFCTAAGLDPTRSVQIALAAHELTQNAVTHCDGTPIDLALELDPAARTIRLCTSNRCTAAGFTAIAARIDRLRGDALTTYVAEMRRAAPEPRGGLGLGRVRYEGELELDASFDGERVTIVAHGSADVSSCDVEERAHA